MTFGMVEWRGADGYTKIIGSLMEGEGVLNLRIAYLYLIIF
jgi:hypothetical protein